MKSSPLGLLLAFAVLAAVACTSSASGVPSGASCSQDSDCPPDASCMWPVTNGCGQKGSCVVPASTSTCDTQVHVCPCDGTAVQLATCGAFSAPVTGSLGCLHAPCTPGQTTCNAGLECLVSECVPPVLVDAGGATDAGASDAPPD